MTRRRIEAPEGLSSFARKIQLGKLATLADVHPHCVQSDYEDHRDSAHARGVEYAQAEADALAFVVDKYSDLAAHKKRIAKATP